MTKRKGWNERNREKRAAGKPAPPLRVELERPGFSLDQGALIWLDDHLDELEATSVLEITVSALRLALRRERTIAASKASRRAADVESDGSARVSLPVIEVGAIGVSADELTVTIAASQPTHPCDSGVMVGDGIKCGRCGFPMADHEALSPNVAAPKRAGRAASIR